MSSLKKLTDQEIDLLQESFTILEDDFPKLIADLYPTFLARHPEHAAYFSETDFAQQRKAVVNLFETVIPKLNQPDDLKKTFNKLSRIHKEYEIPSEAYDDMGAVTIDLLAQYAGEKWNSKLDRVWKKFWQIISEEISNE